MGCHIWYSDEETGRGRSPPRPLLAVPNVTAHPSTASVPITVLLYNGPLLSGFNVPIKWLTVHMYCTYDAADVLPPPGRAWPARVRVAMMHLVPPRHRAVFRRLNAVWRLIDTDTSSP